ncbi:MAG: glycerol kinase [Flavobacteriales bacterium]|nr:glycerol kinase [Flavobacteriales bacterium]|tara:strand:+ start:12323 stop:13819 length:1497 start_codon:yes stop_codon:yes gene_type:complete
MVPYILAIDAGTTSSRAIVFDKDTKKIGLGQFEFSQYFPKNSWVEHDPNEIWASQQKAISSALKAAKINSNEVSAIGITNQRETTIVWDRRSGEPIYNAIVWQDRRTSDYCSSFSEASINQVAKKTGLIVDAYFSASKIRWILQHVEGAQDRAIRGELCFGTVDSWLIHKLTGGSKHITDASNASRTMLYNIHSGTWDKRLCDLFNIPISILPEVVNSSGYLASTDQEVFGAKIPISGIAGDQQSALFGQLCFSSGEAKNTYGTGCFAMTNTGNHIVVSSNKMLSTVAWQLNGIRTYALEGSVYVAGSLIQWLRDGLGFFDHSADVEQLALKEGTSGGITIVPALTGLGAPHWDSYARGAIMGITRGTNTSHIAYASLEAIALSTADVLEAMAKDLGQPLKSIRVDGGASTNDTLMQIQSDLLNCPVIRPLETESTALGAALLAGLGIGIWKSIGELKDLAVIDQKFSPKNGSFASLRNQWNKGIQSTKGWAEPGNYE